MNTLRDVQRGFAAALRTGDAALAARLVRDDGIEPVRRIGIYANNARHNTHATLAAAYPVVRRLGGADWFAQAADGYLAACPSPAGDLQWLGARFADHLADTLAGTAWTWFADVARLEWAYQEVLVAADARPLDTRALVAVPGTGHARLVFRLHPAVRVIGSPWPVLAIWRANQPQAEPAATPTLDQGPTRVLVARRTDHVELRELGPAVHALLAAFAAGLPLAEAADALATAEPAADLAAVLVECVRLDVLAGFEPAHRAMPVTPATGDPA